MGPGRRPGRRRTGPARPPAGALQPPAHPGRRPRGRDRRLHERASGLAQPALALPPPAGSPARRQGRPRRPGHLPPTPAPGDPHFAPLRRGRHRRHACRRRTRGPCLPRQPGPPRLDHRHHRPTGRNRLPPPLVRPDHARRPVAPLRPPRLVRAHPTARQRPRRCARPSASPSALRPFAEARLALKPRRPRRPRPLPPPSPNPAHADPTARPTNSPAGIAAPGRTRTPRLRLGRRSAPPPSSPPPPDRIAAPSGTSATSSPAACSAPTSPTLAYATSSPPIGRQPRLRPRRRLPRRLDRAAPPQPACRRPASTSVHSRRPAPPPPSPRPALITGSPAPTKPP